ncbi:unnamed protein product [Paramecium sonneborni]|uniref:FHA domain-containing protein n=1 Tax=Paramecium sonneborni TaxID=65129 RepID=A0A8S1Q1T6_9CILI|nr:unnamed protein product [Paramecium sonneborni]
MHSQFYQLDLYQDEDHQNMMMECYEGNTPIILKDKGEEKLNILRNIKEFILYQDYLFRCYLKENMPSKQDFDSYIEIYTFDKKQKIFQPYMRMDLSIKKYFTIGNNGLVNNSNLEINELELNDPQIELMHMEVNYEDLLLPIKSKDNLMNNINKRLADYASDISIKIKEQIVNNLIGNCQDKLKIKSLKKQSQLHPLIDINSSIEYQKLKQNNKYKLGGGDSNPYIIKILEIKSSLLILSIDPNIKYQIKGINYDLEYLYTHQQDQEIQMIFQSPTIKIRNEADRKEYILIAHQKNEFSFGRLNTNDIQTNYEHISRNHCLIRFLQDQQYEGGWEIMDLSSAQGTWFVMQDDIYYKIDNQSRIKLGSNILKFELIKKEDATSRKQNNQQEDDFLESLLQL